ncbi:type II secretion system F family protein [Streptomyces sp. NPDC050560]|uniref:type II secretion system F family protein n=1 Tax=Streptomyces sp. NPDC050560 TaxID=3365630 RepID=UPI0037888EA1
MTALSWALGAPSAAVGCAGAAAWLLTGGGGARRRAHAVLPGAPPPRAAERWAAARHRLAALPAWAVASGAWCLLAGAFLAVLGRSVLPLVAGAAAVPLARRSRSRREARGAADGRAEAVIALCTTLIGEVRAGQHPGRALLVAAGEPGVPARARSAVLAAARFGGDVPAALARGSRAPGAEGLRGLAACWRVSVDGGAGLAAGVERLAAALRAERDQRAELRAQLAGARSTAALLAGLPVLGLLLGGALGADPLRVLLHTPAGLGCLVVGGGLEAAGLWWVDRIVRAGEDG